MKTQCRYQFIRVPIYYITVYNTSHIFIISLFLRYIILDIFIMSDSSLIFYDH